MSAVASKEPTTIRIGDTLTWRRDDLQADYPASTWTLKYRAKNNAAGFEITGTPDGDAFAITVTAATSTGYQPGRYEWVAWVENGAGAVHTIDSGQWTLLPNLRANSPENPLDTRTHPRIVLDAIEAVIEKRATKDQLAIAINGRSIQRIPLIDLYTFRQLYRQEVAIAEASERIAQGLPGNLGRIQARI